MRVNFRFAASLGKQLSKHFSFKSSHQAGISETIDYVVKLYDPDTQLQLVNNVFVTGGSANIPGSSIAFY